MEYTLQPIGVIHTPFKHKRDVPIQCSRSDEAGWVEVFPEFQDGLQDLEGFSHIFLLYVFHKSSGFTLRVKPFLDTSERGLFSTRYPARPNPIGLSVVRLRELRDNLLYVDGVDVLDGTPLLDIKPYVPEFDVHAATRTGWHETRSIR